MPIARTVTSWVAYPSWVTGSVRRRITARSAPAELRGGYVHAAAAFDDELARPRLLEERYDARTFGRLSALGPLAGTRCLEEGGGAGSVAGQAGQAGPTGQVVATDADPAFGPTPPPATSRPAATTSWPYRYSSDSRSENSMEPAHLIGRPAAAFNTKDADAFAAPFAEDAEYVNIFGPRMRRRDGIAAGHQIVFESGTITDARDVSARSLASTGTARLRDLPLSAGRTRRHLR